MAEERERGAEGQVSAMEELTRGLAQDPEQAAGRARASGPDVPAAADVAGYQVMAADGTLIGRVERVVRGEDGADEARYLDVDVAQHLAPGRDVRRVLIPFSYARVDDDQERVLLERVRGEDVSNLPPYPDEGVTREYALEFRDRIGNDVRVRPAVEQGFLGQPGKQDTDASK